MDQNARRVLCVEPSSEICHVVTATLHQRGYITGTARPIDQALGMARAGSYDLYIVDDYYRDGPAALLIKRLRALTPHVPIIALCAVTTERNRRLPLDASASVFMPKPEGIYELTRTVSGLLGAR